MSDNLDTGHLRKWTADAIESLDATIFNGDEFMNDEARATMVAYLERWKTQLVTFPADCGMCNGTGVVVRDPDIGTDQECPGCHGSRKEEN